MTIWIAKILTVTVALMHFYFLWLEMFAWTTKAKKVFRNFPADLFEPTKSMAANQGLYNGFLAVGLIWSLLIGNSLWSSNVAIFFLSCVAVAGVYGGFSVSKKIFYVQALPAILALSLWIFIYFTL
jgi:putative membrane protein